MKRTVLAASLVPLFLSGTALAQETTLRLVEVITSPARTETLRGIVADFEAAHPGVTVEITSLPWGQAFETFATMVSAGETPDVVEMPDTWVSLYANNGALENLEPRLAEWDGTADLNERALEFGRGVDGQTAYMLPYGFYLGAMFYNKKLLAEAGVGSPPATIAEFEEASRKVSALPGKYGYCLRGGRGGLNDWTVFANAISGDNQFFHEDGSSTFTDPEKVSGLAWFIDYYKEGLAPPDSVSWGFNETVAGFYSGTCAMLNQDPDALIAISERMGPDDYGVVPLPKGESGKSFPVIGYAGWSMFANSQNKDAAWDLIATLMSSQGNIAWNKTTGALPALNSAEGDPFYASEAFSGWFDQLRDPNVVPTSLPSYLEVFAFFKDNLVPASSQRALLGDITPGEMAQEWADALTPAQQSFQAEQGQ